MLRGEQVGLQQYAAAKSLQSCLTLCDPIDGSSPGSPVPGSPGKNTGVGCHCLLQRINYEAIKSQSWGWLCGTDRKHF